jgi:hypothetical protein
VGQQVGGFNDQRQHGSSSLGLGYSKGCQYASANLDYEVPE